MKHIFTLIGTLLSLSIQAQFEPQVGQNGNNAIIKTSNLIVGWATSGTITRGYQQISDNSLGFANVGTIESAIGAAGTVGVLSLGDGGIAILQFEKPITNGIGIDFAVFENGFLGNPNTEAFLELAFVEVSSNGIDFVRFPAISNIQTNVQVGAFDYINASQINNLAGKYTGGYGTPFDLEQLKDSTKVNINKITHIKIIDVVGSIDPAYGTKDSKGTLINDPFPTGFGSSGFDLDAIGVIHFFDINSVDDLFNQTNSIYPNPSKVGDQLTINKDAITKYEVLNIQGERILEECNSNEIETNKLKTGLYLLKIYEHNSIIIHKIIIQ